MIDLNRSLLSLVATLVVLTAGLFVSSAVVTGAQEYSRLNFVHLDPESGPLTFRGVVDHSGDTFELREVSFGGSAWKEFESNAGIDATILDAEGNVYATFGVSAYSGVAVYGGGKAFGFDPDEEGMLFAVSGVDDSTWSHAILRDPYGARDTIRWRGETGRLHRSVVESEWTLHVDGHDEWWIVRKHGSWSTMVITADTILVSGWWSGGTGAISTRTGNDSIEYRTVNATAEKGLMLRVDDEPVANLSPMTVSAVHARVSTEKETRFLLTDGTEVVLDTSFVVLPFQFLNIVVGHDAEGRLSVMLSERFTTAVADRYGDYWDTDNVYWEDRSRALLFGSIVAAHPNVRRLCVQPSGECRMLGSAPLWFNFHMTPWTEALGFEDTDKRAVAKFDLRPYIGAKRTYIFDATLEGAHVYHYDEFGRTQQSLHHRKFEADSFSVGVIFFGTRFDSLLVKFDNSGEFQTIPQGRTGITRVNLTHPPTPYDIRCYSGGSWDEADGNITGTDGGRSILIVDCDYSSITPVAFEARPGSFVYGIDLVNITRDYPKLRVENAYRTINYDVDNGNADFGEFKDGEWGTYVVRSVSNDTLATFEVNPVDNRFIVVVDGSPREKELRVYILRPEQIGTGEPLVPTNIFRFETTDVPEEQEYLLDLSSEQPRVDQHADR